MSRSRGLSGIALLLFTLVGFALPARAQDEPSIVAYVNPEGTVGNQQFTGSLGMDFDVNLDIMITHLGVFDSASDGLNRPITARLYEREFQEELAFIEFTPDEPGELIGGSRFKELDEPIELSAGDLMTISAAGYGAGEPNGNQGAANLGLEIDAGPCSITFVGGGRYGDPGTPELFPGTPDGGPVNRYAAGTFMFTPLEEIDGGTGGIAYVVPEFTAGNQAWEGTLGLDFNVLQSIQITRLGVFDSGSDGLQRDITARIFDRDTQTPLVAVDFTVDEPGDPEDGSTFKDLESPLVLPAGFRGSVVAFGYGPGEENGNGANLGWTTDDGGCLIAFVGGGRFGAPGGPPDAFPTNIDGGPANRYAAGTFEFEPFEGEIAVPAPPANVTAAAGVGEVTLTWTAPAPPPEIAGYIVLQTKPAPTRRVSSDLVTETSVTVPNLCGGVEYCYTIAAVTVDGIASDVSEEVCVTPMVGEFPDGEFIAYVVPEGTPGNQDFAGALGMDFITNGPIVITQFGVFDDLSDGLVSPINARLYDLETGVELASMDFTPEDPGDPEGGSLFKELDSPLSLPAGFQGTMVASGYGAGDRNGNSASFWTTDDGACQLTFVGGGRFGAPGNPLGFPDSVDGGPANRYAAGTFVYSKFEGGETPEPPENLVATVSDGGTVELSWQPPAGGVSISGYNAYRVSPPPSRRLNADLITETSFTTEAFANGVEVCFAVRAVAANGGFESANSNEPCVVIPPDEPEPEGTIRAYDVPQGTIGNQNFGTPLGLDFDVNADIVVTHLGVFDSGSDGLELPLIATLYDRGVVPEEALATLEFTPDDPGSLYGGSRFKELDEPIDLGEGMYTIVAEGYGAGEPNGNNQPGPPWSKNRGPCSITFVGGGRFGDVPGEFPMNVDGGPENRYAAGTFLFRPADDGVERTGGIAYQVPASTVGNQSFSGSLGMDFNVQVDIVMTRIGVFDSGSDGLSVPITAQLFDRETEEELLRVEFTPEDPGDLEDGSTFMDLDPPMLLRAGFHGTISAAGYGDLEPNGNGVLGWTTDDGGCAIEFVGGGRFGDPNTPGSFPNNVDGGPVNRYAAGTFEFEPAAVGETVFHRGDPNDDGTINITDPVSILNFLFGAGEDPRCAETADVNNDGSVNISDPVGLLNFLFGGGDVPPAPPGPPSEPCGPDPDEPGSPGDLGCEEYVSC